MEPTKQFITLEQAEKLKELGCSQASLFYYDTVVKWEGEDHSIFYDGLDVSENETSHHFSAYTASELGEFLPDEIIKDDYTYGLEQQKLSGEWHVSYMAESETMSWELNDQCSISANEAEARAAMLIYLLENKLINPSNT